VFLPLRSSFPSGGSGGGCLPCSLIRKPASRFVEVSFPRAKLESSPMGTSKLGFAVVLGRRLLVLGTVMEESCVLADGCRNGATSSPEVWVSAMVCVCCEDRPSRSTWGDSRPRRGLFLSWKPYLLNSLQSVTGRNARQQNLHAFSLDQARFQVTSISDKATSRQRPFERTLEGVSAAHGLIELSRKFDRSFISQWPLHSNNLAHSFCSDGCMCLRIACVHDHTL
jgi:hypothetical protein